VLQHLFAKVKNTPRGATSAISKAMIYIQNTLQTSVLAALGEKVQIMEGVSPRVSATGTKSG
jgi:hypothetical protein